MRAVTWKRTQAGKATPHNMDESEHARKALERDFGIAVEAEYDDNGECVTCLHAPPKCPGWHLPDDYEEEE